MIMTCLGSICHFFKLLVDKFLRFIRRRFAKTKKVDKTSVQVEQYTQTSRRSYYPRQKLKRRRIYSSLKTEALTSSCNCHQNSVLVKIDRRNSNSDRDRLPVVKDIGKTFITVLLLLLLPV